MNSIINILDKYNIHFYSEFTYDSNKFNSEDYRKQIWIYNTNENDSRGINMDTLLKKLSSISKEYCLKITKENEDIAIKF